MADETFEMKPGVHNPFVNGLLQMAQSLADEKDAVMEKIAANRDSLRNLKVQGVLSDAQASSIDEFYPVRERKTTDTPDTPENGNGTPATAEDKPKPAAAAKS